MCLRLPLLSSTRARTLYLLVPWHLHTCSVSPTNSRSARDDILRIAMEVKEADDRHKTQGLRAHGIAAWRITRSALLIW